MLNDRSSALSLLKTRRSGRPREMVGPGPSDEELRQILEIAMRVPDHGKLAPWRFVIVGKDQREHLAVLLPGAPGRRPMRRTGPSRKGRSVRTAGRGA